MDGKTKGQAIAEAINNLAAAIREHTEAITREDVGLEEQSPMYDLAGYPID